jgi:hypothetical protein
MAPPNTLTAKKLKVTLVAELLTVPAVDGVPRVILGVQLPDRTATADVAAKSVRKAQATIRASGADGVAVILQGALNAGLSAQPKAPKPPKVAA